MKFTKITAVAIAVPSLFWLSASLDNAQAQKTKGKSRPAETKYLMRGLVRPSCAGLGELLKGEGPADDEAWETAACHAACLSEMSFVLMDDGRCPDGVWAKAASTTLREGSAAVMAAVEKKDLEAANAAFKTLTSACASCHKTHKE